MITDEDTTKIVNKVIEANKLLFYTKDEVDGGLDKRFEEVRQNFSNLQSAVMAFAKGTKDNTEAIEVINHRLEKNGI